MGISERLSPTYFGKLSTTGDFVRYNASGKIMQELDQWFQEGLHHAKLRLNPNWDLAYRKSSVYHFMFHSHQYQQSLIGVFQPSWDSVGRKYPFFVATTMSQANIRQDIRHLLPVIFTSFTVNARSLISQMMGGQILPGDSDAMRRLEYEFNPDQSAGVYRNFKNETILSDYAGRFQNSSGGDVFRTALLNLHDLLQALKNQDVRQLVYGLRFPLGGNPNINDLEIAFWLELVIQKIPQYGEMPFLFCRRSDSENAPYLFMFFALPSPRNLTGLLQTDLDLDTIYKLENAAYRESLKSDSDVAHSIREILENGNQNLSDLQNALASRV